MHHLVVYVILAGMGLWLGAEVRRYVRLRARMKRNAGRVEPVEVGPFAGMLTPRPPLNSEDDDMIRAWCQQQFNARHQLTCPDCLGTDWREGPSGGMSTNVECAHEGCGSRFNVTIWPNESGGAVILQCERIGLSAYGPYQYVDAGRAQ